MTFRAFSIAALLVLAPCPALAQSTPAPAAGPPPVVQQLFECRTISDAAQRLACFDRQVAALEAAQTNREVLIADAEQVRETRRGLFGLSLRGIGGIFGGGTEEAPAPDEITQLESTVSDVATGGGGVVMRLANGQRWVFQDGLRGRAPRAGQPIIIRRASLGGYLATIGDRAAVRVRREN